MVRLKNEVDLSPVVSEVGPFAYQWQVRPIGGSFSDIAGATERVLTIASTTSNEDGTRYRVRVSNGSETVTSDAATLTVTNGSPPQPVITLPTNIETYVAGDTIEFEGFATDPDESGNLPVANLTWEVTFQHDDHDHPVLGRGKDICLPLTTEVGESLLDYLQNARPACSCPEVFLTCRAPYRPLPYSRSLSAIVSSCIRTAGIDSPVKGAHAFRHGLATR